MPHAYFLGRIKRLMKRGWTRDVGTLSVLFYVIERLFCVTSFLLFRCVMLGLITTHSNLSHSSRYRACYHQRKLIVIAIQESVFFATTSSSFSFFVWCLSLHFLFLHQPLSCLLFCLNTFIVVAVMLCDYDATRTIKRINFCLHSSK